MPPIASVGVHFGFTNSFLLFHGADRNFAETQYFVQNGESSSIFCTAVCVCVRSYDYVFNMISSLDERILFMWSVVFWIRMCVINFQIFRWRVLLRIATWVSISDLHKTMAALVPTISVNNNAEFIRYKSVPYMANDGNKVGVVLMPTKYL